VMVDVLAMPDNSFGYVPTPALVLPIEFTMPRASYAAMGGHMQSIVALEDVLRSSPFRAEAWRAPNPWPVS
jgi:hypothetical protein